MPASIVNDSPQLLLEYLRLTQNHYLKRAAALISPLQCNDKGIPYGWHWMAGASSKIPGVSVSDALTLQLLEGSLSTLIPSHMLKTLEPRFQQAKSKLQPLSAEIPAAAWIDKMAYVQPEFKLLAPEVSECCLEAIQDALLYQRQVDCTYYAAHKDREYQLT